jgi:hypothetical protein
MGKWEKRMRAPLQNDLGNLTRPKRLNDPIRAFLPASGVNFAMVWLFYLSSKTRTPDQSASGGLSRRNVNLCAK